MSNVVDHQLDPMCSCEHCRAVYGEPEVIDIRPQALGVLLRRAERDGYLPAAIAEMGDVDDA